MEILSSGAILVALCHGHRFLMDKDVWQVGCGHVHDRSPHCSCTTEHRSGRASCPHATPRLGSLMAAHTFSITSNFSLGDCSADFSLYHLHHYSHALLFAFGHDFGYGNRNIRYTIFINIYMIYQ